MGGNSCDGSQLLQFIKIHLPKLQNLGKDRLFGVFENSLSLNGNLT